MENIVIVGSGGFAREVRWLIDECNKAGKKWNILGWISKEKSGTIIAGLPVLGDDDWLLQYDQPINVALAVGSGALREKLALLYAKNSNITFPNIIAPNASMSDSVQMGHGCIITAQSVFTVDIKIGNFLISNLGSTIGHDCVIGDYVTLFPGAHISGEVTLGKGVSVGTGANLIQGLTIGENTFIGAGAAIISDFPGNCTVVGVPGRQVIKNA